jgi:hypothetical protein
MAETISVGKQLIAKVNPPEFGINPSKSSIRLRHRRVRNTNKAGFEN